jgi:hypothetical protein
MHKYSGIHVLAIVCIFALRRAELVDAYTRLLFQLTYRCDLFDLPARNLTMEYMTCSGQTRVAKSQMWKSHSGLMTADGRSFYFTSETRKLISPDIVARIRYLAAFLLFHSSSLILLDESKYETTQATFVYICVSLSDIKCWDVTISSRLIVCYPIAVPSPPSV